MTNGPRTPRESILAEMAHLKGYEEGVRAVTTLLIDRAKRTLERMEQASPVIRDDIRDNQRETPN